jgi:hypothetical protein
VLSRLPSPATRRGKVAVALRDAHLDGFLGLAVEAVSLPLENLCILRQEVLALHALAAGDGAHENGNVAVLECHLGVGCRHNLCMEMILMSRETSGKVAHFATFFLDKLIRDT